MTLHECHDCPNLGKDHVPPMGLAVAKMLIIGQSPGREEVKLGLPFVGKSGELLDWLLDEVGISREQCYITNVLKCHPPKNRPGSRQELKTCYDNWLRFELSHVLTRCILILGKDAYHSAIPAKVKLKQPFEHGATVQRGKKQTIIISYHPSYFLRRNDTSSFLSLAPTIKEVLNAEDQ